MWTALSIVVAVAVTIGIVFFLWSRVTATAAQDELTIARRQFEVQRPELQQLFFRLAAGSGKPRGLHWADAVWKPEIAFARERESGLLTAFVGVDISFTAVEGGEMESVEAVSEIRDATAVFHFRNGVWGTGGRVLFNISPAEALVRLNGQFEPASIRTT